MADIVQKQSQELANQLWAIANDLRGNMDASKFKNYILGVIFYRYLSERTESYINELLKNDGISYKEALSNEDFAETVLEWSIEHLGYIIEPQHLWSSLIDSIKNGKFSIEQFEKAISCLVASTIGQESELAFEKLFDDMNLQDKDLGKEVSERSDLISKVILNINDISFNVDDSKVDVLGTAYMILISLFASDAGKKGGEFFTPTCASKLLSRLACVGLDEVKSVADSCAGSGSLLLEVQNHLSTKNVGHFYATEKNGSNFNLLRMNLLMHGVPYKKFSCFNADSIKKDNYYENGEPILFDIQVENPPYSAKYAQNQKLLEDPRFSSCGVLAPQGKADLMFVESMVYHMAEDGRIAVLLPSGALYRGKKKKTGTEEAEYVIRKHLIEHLNVVDAIIALPANMFHGAKLPVIVMVLKRKRNGNSNNILFIDASKHFSDEKGMNIITDEDIDRIISVYSDRKDVEKFSRVVDISEIKENNFNCNIRKYVSTFDEEILIDINQNANLVEKCEDEERLIKQKLDSLLEELEIDQFEGLSNKIFEGHVRFKDKDGNTFPAWTEEYLGDLFINRTERGNEGEELLSVTIANGVIKQSDSDKKDSSSEDKSKYKLVRAGDFAYNTMRMWQGAAGVSKYQGIVSPVYTVTKPVEGINAKYFEYLFKTKAMQNLVIAESTGIASDKWSLSFEKFANIEVLLPCIEEQNKIVNFFETIDALIEIQSKKLSLLKNIKTGFLQKLF